MPSVVLRAAFWVSVVGFVASLAVHVATFTELAVPDAALALHFGIFAAFLPPTLGLKAWAEREGHDFASFRGRWDTVKDFVRPISRWQWIACAGLFVYTNVNFLVGFAAMLDAPDAGFSFRMSSGHWMLFYAFSAILTHRMLRDDTTEEAPSAT